MPEHREQGGRVGRMNYPDYTERKSFEYGESRIHSVARTLRHIAQDLLVITGHINVRREGEIMSTQTSNNVKWSEVIFLTFVYASYILVVTAPIGFVIGALKVYRFKRLAEKTTGPVDREVMLIATHYEWLVRTFIFMIVMIMATVGLAYYILGFIIGGLALVWWFYRLIRGAMALIAHRMMPATICTQAVCYGQVESL
jgi:uncharacterized membrane protein